MKIASNYEKAAATSALISLAAARLLLALDWGTILYGVSGYILLRAYSELVIFSATSFTFGKLASSFTNHFLCCLNFVLTGFNHLDLKCFVAEECSTRRDK